VTLQDFALLAPVVMVAAVAIFVLAEEWFNQRAVMREKAAAAASSAAVRPTDANERTIRRIAEMLREVEPTTVSREH
jgi:Flp pilus assembly protein TadG